MTDRKAPQVIADEDLDLNGGGDGSVTPLDALVVINDIGVQGKDTKALNPSRTYKIKS